MWKLVAILLAACTVRSETFTGPNTDAAPGDTPPGETIAVLAGDLEGPITWHARNTYLLNGFTFLRSGTLAIEAGTRIIAEPNSALVITRDARIDARGTATAPIVFTSSRPAASGRDWGGLVLLGKAATNAPGGALLYLGGFSPAYAERIAFGGADNAHDCGTLAYVRIEYAGTATPPGAPPLAPYRHGALTLGACGSDTTIDRVQIHRSSADGIEIGGGAAFLRHVVVTGAVDDAIDWDRGWTGGMQFLVTQQQPGVGDLALEGDNAPGDATMLPRSAPVIFNLTLVGANGAATDPQGGIRLATGTDAMLLNAIVIGFPKYALDVVGAETVARVPGQPGGGGLLYLYKAYLVKATSAGAVWPANFDGIPPDNDGGFDEASFFGPTIGNMIDVDVKLADPFHPTAPSWKPAADSPVLSGCSTPSAPLDTTATFCGAIGATDWTLGWTRVTD